MHAWYNSGMKNEAELRKSLKGLSQDQLIDIICQMDRRYDSLQANFDELRRKYFGVRNHDSAAKGQLSLFNEAEETVDEAVAEELAEPKEIVDRKKKKKTPKNAKLKEVRVITEDIYPEDTHCPVCGKGMQELKPTYVEYLEFRPAEYVLMRYVVHNYTCHECNDENLDCEIYTGDTSKLPARLIDQSIATSSVISHTATDKFLLGLPFYRQSKDLEYRGIFISRQVLCQWLMRVGDDYLVTVFERMKRDLRKCEILNMDETTLECLEDLRNEQRSKSYTWLAMSGIHEQNQMALYFYNASREHSFIYEILGPDYHGVIQSDGYGAYDGYEPAEGHAGCAAHCQRYFVKAAQAYGTLYKKFTSSKNVEERKAMLEANPSFAKILHILNQFTGIYKIEDKLKAEKAEPEDITDTRRKESLPFWEEILRSAKEIKEKYVMSEKLRKAVVYTENQYPSLIYYINDSRLSPDNNLAEREGIKPYVMARKNFLFSDTKHGATISCVYFSLLISARLNKLNPEKYLTYLLDQLSTYGLKDDVIERCLPYSRQLPEYLQISKSHST